MTISSTSRKAGPFTGTGLQTVYPFAFKVFAAADVFAVLVLTSTGVETPQVLTTNYTVLLNADQNASPGGNLTMLVAPPAGATLTLTSQVPNTQSTDLTNAGGFYPKVINDALDRLTILSQQLAEKVGRGLGLSLSGSTGVSTLLPNPVALAVIGWNAAGTALQNFAGTSSAAVSLFMASVVAAVDAVSARAGLGAAASGANADITSLTGITTPLSVTRGGTGAITPNAAADALGAFRRGTLLGPVSQTAGVPTGAVIERGSNANGEFVRFADGLQICAHTGVIGTTAGADIVLTSPAAYISAPHTSVSVRPGGANDTVCSYSESTTTVSFRASNTFAANTIKLISVGRWF